MSRDGVVLVEQRAALFAFDRRRLTSRPALANDVVITQRVADGPAGGRWLRRPQTEPGPGSGAHLPEPTWGTSGGLSHQGRASVRGGARNRTTVRGFAVPCLATRPRRRRGQD